MTTRKPSKKDEGETFTFLRNSGESFDAIYVGRAHGMRPGWFRAKIGNRELILNSAQVQIIEPNNSWADRFGHEHTADPGGSL